MWISCPVWVRAMCCARDVITAIEGRNGSGSRDRGLEHGPLTPDSRLWPRGGGAAKNLFRQPEGSYIITNAHRINQRQLPVMSNRNPRTSSCFGGGSGPRRQSGRGAGAGAHPRKFGFKSEDIQVLSPMHRGVSAWRRSTMPCRPRSTRQRPWHVERQLGNRVYRVGDRVMQIRNNYDKDVYQRRHGVHHAASTWRCKR